MDRTAFDALFAEYAPRVRAYLVRQGLGSALAEEVVQEVMLTVWRENARFDPEKGSMSTWVFTIARNRLIDSVRRRRRPEPDPEDPCWVGDRDVVAPSPETRAALRERVRELRAAFFDLPAEQRAVLEGLYFEGQSMSEHSEATGVPLGTVKTRARLALRALRGRVSGGDEE
ncbi:MAG TPA: sigma-70 family RNA polymerase sigma factor [Polyangiaceae bacterium]|nr:sigma-70 family RNA polymerase sigma factor [Polyangiaceae bacterium]